MAVQKIATRMLDQLKENFSTLSKGTLGQEPSEDMGVVVEVVENVVEEVLVVTMAMMIHFRDGGAVCHLQGY